MNTQRINSPEGVKLLMENIWLRHQAGLKQHPDNVFMVDLLPLTEDEKAEIRSKNIEDDMDDDVLQYCAQV